MTEQDLIEKAKSDPLIFGELYDRYYPKISNYILRRVGEVQASQDITSDVFFKAMNSLDKYEWRGLPFSAWLYRIAANEINSYFRTPQSKLLSLDELQEDHHFEPASPTDLHNELIAAQEEAARYADFRLIRRLLRELPFKYQEVLALRYFEKKSLKDIAIITDKNLNTVKSLLARGIEQLRTKHQQTKMRPQVQPFPARPVLEGED